MSATDDLLANNRRFAAAFDGAGAPGRPARGVVVIACMDARLDPAAALGLEPGDAHVIRNAGGSVTDDTIRSLVVSQRLLGTREVVLIHHTECGMASFRSDEMKDAVEADTGVRPPFDFETFTDTDADVRESMTRIRESPFVPYRKSVRGFVYDVGSGVLREVVAG